MNKQAKEDFQFKSEHKNPEGGLSEKGRKAYNRATGGNLKRPQPEGGARRDSFCARMKGMKAKLTSAETARDPDSRINKSLRKWKCSHVLEQAIKLASKPGLWANIHAKRKRGEAPAKPGSKDYPDAENWKKVTKESEKEAAKRCWKGYEPVPGKKPYSDDSCRLISGKKKKNAKKANVAMNVQQYMGQRARRELTEEEQAEVEKRKRKLLPAFFTNLSDSPATGIYSPILPTLGAGSIGGLLGAALGGPAIAALRGKKPGLLGKQDITGERIIGGAAGAGLAGLLAYLDKQRDNANIEETMRRLPEGGNLRDYLADPLIQKNKDDAMRNALLALVAAKR